jgi:hypothetical protein
MNLKTIDRGYKTMTKQQNSKTAIIVAFSALLSILSSPAHGYDYEYYKKNYSRHGKIKSIWSCKMAMNTRIYKKLKTDADKSKFMIKQIIECPSKYMGSFIKTMHKELMSNDALLQAVLPYLMDKEFGYDQNSKIKEVIAFAKSSKISLKDDSFSDKSMLSSKSTVSSLSSKSTLSDDSSDSRSVSSKSSSNSSSSKDSSIEEIEKDYQNKKVKNDNAIKSLKENISKLKEDAANREAVAQFYEVFKPDEEKQSIKFYCDSNTHEIDKNSDPKKYYEEFAAIVNAEIFPNFVKHFTYNKRKNVRYDVFLQGCNDLSALKSISKDIVSLKLSTTGNASHVVRFNDQGIQSLIDLLKNAPNIRNLWVDSHANGDMQSDLLQTLKNKDDLKILHLFFDRWSDDNANNFVELLGSLGGLKSLDLDTDRENDSINKPGFKSISNNAVAKILGGLSKKDGLVDLAFGHIINDENLTVLIMMINNGTLIKSLKALNIQSANGALSEESKNRISNLLKSSDLQMFLTK